jgi:cbb3-type cytochrome oxidase subunit 3
MKQAGLSVDYWIYLSFGLLLVAALGWVTVHYFSKNRKKGIEEAKYKMLDDDD